MKREGMAASYSIILEALSPNGVISPVTEVVG
jgi:hypothetical protein